jgi:hypothetical protein
MRPAKYPWAEAQIATKGEEPISGKDADIKFREEQDALYEYGDWCPVKTEE